MEPFPRSIDSWDDWRYFLDAFRNLNNHVSNLASDLSDIYRDYGFKDLAIFDDGADMKIEFYMNTVYFTWDDFSFELPTDYLLASDPKAKMIEDVEEMARERDNEVQAQQDNARQTADQIEIERIRRRMAEDPDFAQEVLKKMGM